MKTTIFALTLAASAAMAVPAFAGGVLSFSYDAKNAEEAHAIRAGLTIYQVVNDIQTNGHISQNGANNLAALAQGGSGHVGIIHQEGNNHNGSIHQTGSNNGYGLFQFGTGANGHVQQHGNGEAGLTLQIGY